LEIIANISVTFEVKLKELDQKCCNTTSYLKLNTLFQTKLLKNFITKICSNKLV